jgi:hypothetical protein
MNKHIKLSLTYASIVVLCLETISPVALAATPTTTPSSIAKNGQALEIAPPLLYLTVNPGQVVHTQILIRDIASGNLIVTGQVNDFVADGEDGAPKVLLNSNYNDPYSLKGWVTPLPSLELIPEQIKTLPVTLNIPANASPGGHYGVIRFTATAPSLQGSGVSLSASLGALILLTVSGKITEHLSVQEFSVNHTGKTGTFFESGPLNFVERLKNTGNVHVEPAGQVQISDMFGKNLATVNVNVPPGNILPSSTRKFSQSLDKTVIGNKRLFGRYRANLKITYGTSKKVLATSLVFWVIPVRLIAIIIALLIIGLFLLRYAIRRYNRYILDRAQKSRHNRQPPSTP